MEQAHAGVFLMSRQARKIVCTADVDVLLREVVSMDECLANLVDVIEVFALFGIIALEQEIAVAMLDDRFGVGLDFVNTAQDLDDLCVQSLLRAEEDIPIRVGSVVPRFHQRRVASDLAVVAADELQEAHDAALVHSPESEG